MLSPVEVGKSRLRECRLLLVDLDRIMCYCGGHEGEAQHVESASWRQMVTAQHEGTCASDASEEDWHCEIGCPWSCGAGEILEESPPRKETSPTLARE